MAYEVFVEKADESSLRIYSDEVCVHEELYEHFKVKDPTHRPNRFSRYDGMVRLYDKSTGKIGAGLLRRVLAKLKNYKVTVDKSLSNFRKFNDEELEEWIESLGLPFKLYDYQFNIVRDFVKYRKLTALADTNAGKSVVLYVCVRYLLESKGEDSPILLCVPNIMLVEQILEDFISYGWVEARSKCQQIKAGAPKAVRKPVVVSTWQSIQDMPRDYFEVFLSAISDEVHLASANKQTKIFSYCTNAEDRLGVTGTLNGTGLHQMQIESLFGPAVRYVDTQTLKDMGQSCQTQVRFVNIAYERADRLRAKRLDYEGHIQFTLKHQGRRRAIANIINSMTTDGKNSLCIFERIEDGLMEMKAHFENELGLYGRVEVICGDVSANERERIKKRLEAESGIILLATWGTLSTGVSIKRLHHLFFTSSSKGLIRILQSVGRMLRIHESKEIAYIIDFIDDFRTTPTDKSYFVEHSKERAGFYKLKGHPMSVSRLPMKDLIDKELYQEIWKDSEKRRKAKAAREEKAAG